MVDGVPMSALGRRASGTARGHRGRARRRDVVGVLRLPGPPAIVVAALGRAHGFTAIALDRPGYGASAAVPGRDWPIPTGASALAYGAVDKILADGARGAGLFLVAHSAGCELALRMAVSDRSADLFGRRVGRHRAALPARTAKAVISQATVTSRPAGLRDLLWQPTELYPAEVLTGGAVGAGRGLRRRRHGELGAARLPRCRRAGARARRVQRRRPRERLGVDARRARRHRRAVHRRHRGSWSTKWPTADTISASASLPTSTTDGCCRSSRNASVPKGAAHRRTRKRRRVDASRIHRIGQPGRPDGAPDRRGRLRPHAVGAPGRLGGAVRRHRGQGGRHSRRTGRGQRPGLPLRRRRRRRARGARRATPGCWRGWRPAGSSPSTAPSIPTPAARSRNSWQHRVFR